MEDNRAEESRGDEGRQGEKKKRSFKWLLSVAGQALEKSRAKLQGLDLKSVDLKKIDLKKILSQ